MPNAERSSTESLLLFISGAVAGAALTLLVSPEVRRKTSEQLQSTLKSFKEGTSDFLENEREIVAEGGERLRGEANTLRAAYHAGWDAFRETLRKDGEAEEAPPSS